jgi:N-acetyl-anhydromuramyl-L-alanine amidase AmpD
MTNKLYRIIIHWTAGTNQPNNTDFEHYHFLINGDGILFNGKYTPKDNINCNDGKYAQHTGHGNTGSIGIAVCGMYGFNEKTLKTRYPLRQIQCEKLFFECARLCKKYNIPVENVTTHYEFNLKHEIKTGKIDIVYLPPYPHIKKENIADFIRNKILWYYKRI